MSVREIILGVDSSLLNGLASVAVWEGFGRSAYRREEIHRISGAVRCFRVDNQTVD